jgi:S1-C subfamily serine protease
MKRLLALCAFLVLVAAAEQRPGWLGFAMVYHRPTSSADGWMHVQAVAPNSPAAKGGLEPHDVITHLNGAPLRFATDEEILAALAKIRPGDRVAFRVRRGAETADVVVIAAAMSDEMWRLWQQNHPPAKKP